MYKSYVKYHSLCQSSVINNTWWKHILFPNASARRKKGEGIRDTRIAQEYQSNRKTKTKASNAALFFNKWIKIIIISLPKLGEPFYIFNALIEH